MTKVSRQRELRTVEWGGMDCWAYALELCVAQRTQIEKAFADLLSFSIIASGPDFTMLAAADGTFAVCLRDAMVEVTAKGPAPEAACSLLLMTRDVSDVLHNLKATGAKYSESVEGGLRKIEFRILTLGVVVYGSPL